MSTERVFLIHGAVQSYAWGKHGLDSEVARLAQCGNEEFRVNSSSTYAELWMGTHSKGPSVIESSGENLSSWVEAHPDCLGDNFSKVFSSIGQLPFLFKVLSVNIALSIQVHPNKTDAVRLHREHPELYPDDNHKPEMAIALTPFEALCGFRPVVEIITFLKNVPEFRSLIGDKLSNALSSCPNPDADCIANDLKSCFSALMTSPESLVTKKLHALVNRINQDKSANLNTSSCLGDLLLRLHDQFPGDVGCFCIYFLNFVTLDIGQAIFLNANLPHAYLYGDCLECMACSDNVVRAGLTPKLKDVSTLLDLLEYRSMSVVDTMFKCHSDPADLCIQVYDPPVLDFAVSKIQLPVDMPKYVLSPINGASIVIIICGAATGTTLAGNTISLKRGSILFVSAKESLTFTVLSLSEGLLMFRAYCLLT
jgi:mannose-6-phosphate isomerase